MQGFSRSLLLELEHILGFYGKDGSLKDVRKT